MGIGPVELALLASIVVVSLLARLTTHVDCSWLLGVIACFTIAVVVTPADPLSMALVALPYTAAFVIYRLVSQKSRTMG